ncbi:glycosyltransferase family 2 protein [Butyrivibrio sp. MC2013]|uniref:glycosyltransferase family 2 protein n=1 Tax=Butyrivibrio sp. MC2013 TaxID=1280686 RepID=UPI00047A3F16|nr:glycosyltransferase [Butyrivibrio sp. MC2013]
MERTQKLVSVIITTYKRPVDVLMRGVRSVLDQTYDNLELIIINDHPDEESSLEISSALSALGDDRICYYVNESNSGACYSRNRGIRMSKGEYIALLDDDDSWEPDKLERHLPFFDDPQVAMVYGGMNYYSNNRVRRFYPYIKDDDIFPEIVGGNAIGGCSVPVIRRSILDEVGMFDEAFPSCQDLDLWIRICKDHKVTSINECLTNYYYSDEAITRSLKRQIDGFELIINKYRDVFEQNPRLLVLRRKTELALCIEKGSGSDIREYYSKYMADGGSVTAAVPVFAKAAFKRMLAKIGFWKL